MSAKLAQYNQRVIFSPEGTKEQWTGYVTETTRKFIENRYVVLRNFIPKELVEITLDAWKVIESHPASQAFYFGDEQETTFDTPASQQYLSKGAYCFPPAVGLHHWMMKELRKHLTISLKETYSYSRVYSRNAVLNAHYDRPSCEISVTTVLDYKTDDNKPWTIWLQNDKNYLGLDQLEAKQNSQDIPVRKRTKAIPISLEPGDILLYQGPNVVHWRDSLVGDYSRHMFFHFYNEFSPMTGWKQLGIQWNPQVEQFPVYDYNNNYGCVLSYDGRETRYQTDETEVEKLPKRKKFMQFIGEYQKVQNLAVEGDEDHRRFLQDGVNNYYLEFKDKDDGIQQEED